ncbi:dimethylargininase [Serinibacter salmoneus]|uniref:Ornithine--oxo-acid transaminase n=1 Tax=Serinibacter salmoneus TaxID=556530 RepID=A0A2A9CXM6_9MICO|nr:dimethylargininase [Serinibacter salmoneus]PFG18765.1 ornithine--oxo-acid transaminase [Serinibacter salmoneus]
MTAELTARSTVPTSDPTTATTAEPTRVASSRHYLMCRPTHFDVTYAINPWMHPDVPVDHDLVMTQWENLRRTYTALGHRVEVIEGAPGLPDMVFAANGATVVDDVALAVRFHYPQRAGEARHYADWLRRSGYRVVEAMAVNEGEGDFLAIGDRVLAATGFRSDPASHAELAAALGREVVSLELVDPRFYHIDTALTVLDDATIAYFPAAFSPASRARLAALYPGAIEVDEADACVLGLNAVSDGRHVVVAAQATRFAAQLHAAGFTPVPVDLSELLKGGGGIKCCTLELRHAPTATSPGA